MESINFTTYSSFAIVNNNGKQEIYSWGSNFSGQLGLGDTIDRQIPTLLKSSSLGNYESIEQLIQYRNNANSCNTMAIVSTLEGKKIYVWGNNSFGQLGIGNTANQSNPILFDVKQFGDFSYSQIKKISFGGDPLSPATLTSSYIILSTTIGIDQIYVWGYNSSHGLGIGNNANQTSPILFDTTQFGSSFKTIKEFSLGYTSYAIIEDDMKNERLYLWGRNDEGECATNSSTTIIKPLQLTTSFLNGSKIKIFKMNYLSMYLVLTRNGVDELIVWGDNSYGQLSTGLTNKISDPYKVDTILYDNAAEIIDVHGFQSTYLQVRINGERKLYVCGYNQFGQLGIGGNANQSLLKAFDMSRLGNPIEIYDSSFGSKYVGSNSAFAYVKTLSGDRLYTWGLNSSGQLGLGDTANRFTPVLITTPNLSSAKILSFSKSSVTNFSLILDRNGQSESYVSGLNQFGQLGNGNKNNVSSFTPILPTRYTNPQPKIMPNPNLTSSQALELINPNNNLVRTELDKYVDTTSFPAGATLSIDPATTTSDYQNGILNLGIRTNQYNDLLIVNTQIGPKTFNVTIPGFRPVTDVNTNPVSVIIRDAEGNNIDKIYDQLVDSTYKVINRDLLEYYFDLSSIPPNAIIHLYRTSFGNDTEATFTLTSSQVYGNNGLIVSNQLYVKTDLVWTFTSSQLNLALVISLSVVGGLLLIGAIIAIMLVRRSSNRLII